MLRIFRFFVTIRLGQNFHRFSSKISNERSCELKVSRSSQIFYQCFKKIRREKYHVLIGWCQKWYWHCQKDCLAIDNRSNSSCFIDVRKYKREVSKKWEKVQIQPKTEKIANVATVRKLWPMKPFQLLPRIRKYSSKLKKIQKNLNYWFFLIFQTLSYFFK